MIILKILVCTHHSCKHLLQQTVARTLKHTVEAATPMIVATPTNDQENCINNSINLEVIALLLFSLPQLSGLTILSLPSFPLSMLLVACHLHHCFILFSIFHIHCLRHIALDSAAYSTAEAVTKSNPLQGMWLLPVSFLVV